MTVTLLTVETGFAFRKRGTRNEETQTNGGNTKKTKKTIVVVGVDQDGDSGQGLLVVGNGHVHGAHNHNHNHGHGHGHGHNHAHRKHIVGPLEHPVYTRPKRADKSAQIDFDSESEYDDVMIYDGSYTLEDIESDVSSIHSASSQFNHKCVQVRRNKPYMTTAGAARSAGHHSHGGGKHGMSPGRHSRPVSPSSRPPRPMSPARHTPTSQALLKRSHGIDDIVHKLNQKPLPPRRTSRNYSESHDRNATVGIDVNYIINDIHVEPAHTYAVQRRKHSSYRINDSDVDSCSDTDMERIKRESLASMSELAEMTMAPENTMESNNMAFNSETDSDWDQRSAISI